MAATVTINAPSVGSVPNGTAVDASHFTGFNGITNTGGCTWETDEQGERYILIPAGTGPLLQIRPHNWTEMIPINNFAFCCDVMYERVAGPAIGDFSKTIVDVDSGADRVYMSHRVFELSGQEVVQFIIGGGANFVSAEPEFNNVPIGTRFTHGQGFIRAVNGGFGYYLNGRCVFAADGDVTAMTQPGNIGRVEFQSRDSYNIRLYGPFKYFDSDFEGEPEFLPENGYGTKRYESPWRHIPSGVHGPWDITYSGSASQLPTKYIGSGTNPRRLRSVCSGAAGNTITYTLKSEHKIGAANQYANRIPLRVPGLMLPGGASSVWTIGGDGMGNPLRVRVDGSSGTSTARPVEFDPGTGSYVSTGIEINQAHRYEFILLLGTGSGNGSLIVHNLSLNSGGVVRTQYYTIGFDGLIADIDTCTMQITMGSSGNPEFEGVVNPKQIQWNLVSSYVSTDIVSASVSMAVANNFGQGNFGQFAPNWFTEQSPTYDSSNPLGRSGRGITTLAQEVGGLGVAGLLPHLRGQLLCMLEWQANDAWADVSSYVKGLIDACNQYGVEQLWATQLPVDDSSAEDQDAVRSNNSMMKSYAKRKAGDGVIYLSDVAALYSDSAAAALSTDDLHLTQAGFAQVGPQIEQQAKRLASLGGAGRGRRRRGIGRRRRMG